MNMLWKDRALRKQVRRLAIMYAALLAGGVIAGLNHDTFARLAVAIVEAEELPRTLEEKYGARLAPLLRRLSSAQGEEELEAIGRELDRLPREEALRCFEAFINPVFLELERHELSSWMKHRDVIAQSLWRSHRPDSLSWFNEKVRNLEAGAVFQALRFAEAVKDAELMVALLPCLELDKHAIDEVSGEEGVVRVVAESVFGRVLGVVPGEVRQDGPDRWRRLRAYYEDLLRKEK